MKRKTGFCPAWSWWLRSGERLALGMHLGAVLDPDALGLKSREAAGLESVQEGLGTGLLVVVAMRKAGLMLPVEGWCLLEAGEHTGHLGEAMREVGTLLKERELQRRALLGQLWYPVMVLTAGLFVMGLILLWVVPEMREISRDMGLGDQLPWLTEHIGQLYGGCFAGLLGLVLFTVSAGVAFRIGTRRSVAWGKAEEAAMNLLPLAGSCRRWLREARFLQHTSILIKGGTALPRALERVAESIPNLWEQEQVLAFRSHLLLGAGFVRAAASCPLIGEGSLPLLEAGNESGRLEIYMERLSTDLREAVRWKLQQATRALEPLFLLVLSAAIAGLILAYLLPMVRMLEQAGGAF